MQSSVPVALLEMPFGMIEAPASGISLLKSALYQKGFRCDVYYFSLAYGAQIGFETYRLITKDQQFVFSLVGEWLFAPILFDPNPQADEQYVQDILRQDSESAVTPIEILALLRLREQTAKFIRDCLDATDWSQYKIVGFSSSYQQNCAALGLARLIKSRYPDVTIAFGGANCMDEMGAALLRLFPFIDVVCTGEGDASFPMLVDAVLKGQPYPPIPNILYRNGSVPAIAPGRSTPDMDSLPYPDFDDYFVQLERTAQPLTFQPYIPLETSRGCWWGQKRPCTFCGLSGSEMTYRHKSAKRALDEIILFKDKYGKKTSRVCFTDIILDYRYFKTLLPDLAAADLKLDFFWEVKTNLTREQVSVLAKSGASIITPGIESFSDAVLRLMNKGTTCLQNIQTLKWCKQFGIKTAWLVLYGFPGEDAAEYDAMARLMPLLFHLEAPQRCRHILFPRLSAYAKTPERYGITRLRPTKVYQYIYHTLDWNDLMQLSQIFDADYTDQSGKYEHKLKKVVDEWQSRTDARLDVFSTGQSIKVIDSRQPAVEKEYIFDGLASEIYLLCDEMQSMVAIFDAFGMSAEVDEGRVAAILDSFIDKGLMIRNGTRYLSLAVNRCSHYRTNAI